jgi:hypothetical protein
MTEIDHRFHTPESEYLSLWLLSFAFHSFGFVSKLGTLTKGGEAKRNADNFGFRASSLCVSGISASAS